MTPDELREIARVLDQEGKKLVEQGEPVKGARAFKTAQDYRRAADELAGLPSREQAAKVNKVDSQAHAFATSMGRSQDALVQAANGARMTLRELAAKVGMQPGHLSMARRGDRAIRESAALKIEELTGFKASKTNWPRGIIRGK